MKYEKSKLIQIQTKDNLVILRHKINTLIILTNILKKCEKCKMSLDRGTEGVLDIVYHRADFQCMLQYEMFPQTLNYKNL